MKQLSWILIAGAGIAAAGCGQKGPLVLPDKNAKVITRPAGSRATPPAQTPPGQTPPAPGPQESAPQPPPEPTSQDPTKPRSDKSDDAPSATPPPRS
jgi:predicted small lipoprotein YifL